MANISPGTPPGKTSAGSAHGVQADPVAVSIELLARQGYDATTVEELADATGISRSTFFRKFGSKEDIVFADHDVILARVREHLAADLPDPLTALAESAQLVFDHHVRHRATSLARHALLQQVPALRDRELVTSYRYEAEFRSFLLTRLPESERRGYGSVAVSAAAVAVHNAFLRQWLRSPGTDLSAALGEELRQLMSIFRPVLFGVRQPRPRPAVVVTVLDPDAGTETILDAVRAALA